MGFDLTGLNPKNIKVQAPERPDRLHELSKEEVEKYFEEREKYTSQSGTYFRNNVWWWRPLAFYVLEHTKVIDEKDKKNWSYNDEYIVDEEHATQIANQLNALIKKGHTKRFEATYEARRKTLELQNDKVEKELSLFSKRVCKKMKKKNLAPCDFPIDDKKTWDRIYKKRNSDASYPFSVENVKEFADFCKNSGGFTIG